MDDQERVDQALGALRDATEGRVLERPADAGAPAVVLTPPADIAPAELERLAARVAELEPWEQGPFPLGPDLVAGETGGDERRWRDLHRHVTEDVPGRRVLDVGSGAGYDSFAFAALGAAEVLGCEWTGAIEQARFLEGVYASGVTFAPLGWEELDPERHGTFDVVHCHGVLQRVAAPMNLLGRLWRMTAPGGPAPDRVGDARRSGAVPTHHLRARAPRTVRRPSGSRAGSPCAGWSRPRASTPASGWASAGWWRPTTVSGYLRARRAERGSGDRLGRGALQLPLQGHGLHHGLVALVLGGQPVEQRTRGLVVARLGEDRGHRALEDAARAALEAGDGLVEQAGLACPGAARTAAAARGGRGL